MSEGQKAGITYRAAYKGQIHPVAASLWKSPTGRIRQTTAASKLIAFGIGPFREILRVFLLRQLGNRRFMLSAASIGDYPI